MPTAARMTEVVMPHLIEPDGLLIQDRDLPAPAPGQALVRVEATGVSFAEQQMRRGKYYDQPSFPFVPGYDFVGTVEATGDGVDPAMVGTRVAAVVKTGGWASHVLTDAAHLVPVPAGIDPADAETVIVNGITAWQMLHTIAKAQRGQTIVVLGANGGVGSTLVQLAVDAGLTVIGTAAPRHHDQVRSLGAIPVDYQAPDLPARLRELAPDGVDAVFDHVGGTGLQDSWRLLRRGGTLVSYGSAATKDAAGTSQLPVFALFMRVLLWNILPNGRRARFYNFWAGKRNPTRFYRRLRDDLTQVLGRLAAGTLEPQVAARLPLVEAGRALALAESHTVAGKVVLEP
ncbi:medium chain dehydrogenase/reductase family protein [Pengzhenrongella sicca]|uniref:Zinc-binding dehydrogenase n=1 Tax=Pengzhenrongella sicca TaxID=2819238 RepID=A0A8A4ZDN0_9MICO|nr:medium chain dehydrogenase/reductase family protein [Pengzhenrongella sicca]QTE29003.1 zinc-binding dehydrogenase [Pengzhenrongella sicca]